MPVPAKTRPVQTPPLILASSSPYRAQMLDRLGLPFSTAASGIDETPAPGESLG